MCCDPVANDRVAGDFCTAMPFRSRPEDAAVAEVLGTLAVSVAVILIMLQWNAEPERCDLGDFLEQALTHLGAAVVQVNRAVLIDMHQGTGLVQVREREGNAEFHRGQSNAAFDHFGLSRSMSTTAVRRSTYSDVDTSVSVRSCNDRILDDLHP